MKNIVGKSDVEKVLSIITDAGGEIVGLTRLHNIACLLELAGVGEGFFFVYKRYGPFCDELTWAVESACVMKTLHEKEKLASWGGKYSIYSLPTGSQLVDAPIHVRKYLLDAATTANPIDLELAVTAAYFKNKGMKDPWEEVSVCKAHMIKTGRLTNAKQLYEKFRSINSDI